MLEEIRKWLPLDQAAKHYGYRHADSLRRRLRELRERGYVVDLGNPPSPYKVGKNQSKGKVVIYWPNPNTALIRRDAPAGLLIPKRGKRARNSDT